MITGYAILKKGAAEANLDNKRVNDEKVQGLRRDTSLGLWFLWNDITTTQSNFVELAELSVSL